MRPHTKVLTFEDWGLISYETALDKMLRAHAHTVETQSLGQLVFCTHPPVITLGRASETSDQPSPLWNGEVIEVSRGGRATYHGPDQLVVYPIVNLSQRPAKAGFRDVHKFLRDLESAIAWSLHILHPTLHKVDVNPPHTGLWIHGKKITSIGIAVRNWVTYHGASINLFRPQPYGNLHGFAAISPCGFTPDHMTSLEEQLPSIPTHLRETLIQELVQKFRNSFEV